MPVFHANIIRLPFLTTVIKPCFYFGGLLLLRKFLDMTVSGSMKMFLPRRVVKWSLIFLFIVMASLAMPVLLEGKVHVLPIEHVLDTAVRTGFENNLVPLRLERVNFTQILYPLFFIFLFFVMASEIRTPEQLHRILKVNVALAVAVVLNGLFYLFSFVLKNPYLIDSFYSFTTGLSKGIPRRSFEGSGGISRIYTIAGEPALTGAFLLFALGQIAVLVLMKRTDLLWGKKISFALLIFLSLGLLLTGSTTGYVGIPVLWGSLLFLPRFRTRTRRISNFAITRSVLVVVAGLFAIALLLFAFYVKINIFDYVRSVHVNKLMGVFGSGALRIVAAKNALKIFARYPLLGIGFGSNQSGSLLMNLLSNIGLLGTLPFLFFNWLAFKKGMKVYRTSTNDNLAVISLALIVSFVSLFWVMLLQSSVSLTLSYYWLILAMLVAAYRFYENESISGKYPGKIVQKRSTFLN